MFLFLKKNVLCFSSRWCWWPFFLRPASSIIVLWRWVNDDNDGYGTVALKWKITMAGLKKAVCLFFCDLWSVRLFFPIYVVFVLLLEVFKNGLLCFLICCCHLHIRWVELLTQKICLHLEHEGEQHRGHCCRFYIPLLHNSAVECVSMKLAAQWYFRVVSVWAIPEISTDNMTSV